MTKNETALLIGVAGFIGFNLAKRFLLIWMLHKVELIDILRAVGKSYFSSGSICLLITVRFIIILYLLFYNFFPEGRIVCAEGKSVK